MGLKCQVGLTANLFNQLLNYLKCRLRNGAVKVSKQNAVKSIAIFQLVNGDSRIVDGLYTSVQKGIDAYDKYFHGGMTFIWDCINDIPFSIQDNENITDADVETMYTREEEEWSSTEDLIRYAQERLDSGNTGIYSGIRLVKIGPNNYNGYRFIIEIRHIHE